MSRNSAEPKAKPQAVDVQQTPPAAPKTSIEITVLAKSRGNRDVYFVANDVLSGDIVRYVRDVVRNAPPDRDITFTLDFE